MLEEKKIWIGYLIKKRPWITTVIEENYIVNRKTLQKRVMTDTEI